MSHLGGRKNGSTRGKVVPREKQKFPIPAGRDSSKTFIGKLFSIFAELGTCFPSVCVMPNAPPAGGAHNPLRFQPVTRILVLPYSLWHKNCCKIGYLELYLLRNAPTAWIKADAFFSLAHAEQTQSRCRADAEQKWKLGDKEGICG